MNTRRTHMHAYRQTYNHIPTQAYIHTHMQSARRIPTHIHKYTQSNRATGELECTQIPSPPHTPSTPLNMGVKPYRIHNTPIPTQRHTTTRGITTTTPPHPHINIHTLVTLNQHCTTRTCPTPPPTSKHHINTTTTLHQHLTPTIFDLHIHPTHSACTPHLHTFA